MNDQLVYLAGQITGAAYSDATDWRTYVQDHLPPPLVGVSPLRAKDYLSTEESIDDAYENHPLSCSKGITRRDHFDVRRCDLLFANLQGVDRVSIGTVMEIAWAFQLGTPIVLVMEKEGNLHDHAMIRTVVDYHVHDLETGIAIATAVLHPNPPPLNL